MSTLEAGRELDALVAEKAMDWSECRSTNEYGYVQHYDETVWIGQSPEGETTLVPAYSTDDAAALTVLDKFAAEGDRQVSLAWEPEAGIWWCVIYKPEGVDQRWRSQAEAKTRALAICLAALDACGVRTA